MKYQFRVSNQSDITVLAICLTILLYLSRTAIPFLKFPFIVIFLIIILYTITSFKFRLLNELKLFGRSYLLPIILFLLLVISFFLSNKLYLTIFKDICNFVILFTLFFFLTLYLSKKSELNFFVHTFTNLLILFALLISLYGLGTLFNIFSVGGDLFSKEIPKDLTKDLLSIDYNFALLLVFFGMIGLIHIITRPKTLIEVLLIDLILTIYSINIFFSSSRRGGIILICIVLSLFGVQLFSFFKRKSWINHLATGSRYFLINLIVVIVLFLIFTFYTSCEFKNKTLYFIGSKNIVATKAKIALKVYKYNSIFKQSKSYSEIYNILWSPDTTSRGIKDPDTGWGVKIHKTVFPLYGENVEIVPTDAKGYMMDYTCNADTLNGYALSATWVSKEFVDETKILEASVYCYLSPDCDLTMVEICSLGIMGNPGAEYDLKKKGRWQKLEYKVNCIKGRSTELLYFSKKGVNDFSKMKGYVIFAYPLVKIIEKKDTPLSFSAITNIITKSESQSINTAINENSIRHHEAGVFNLKEIIYEKLFSSAIDSDLIRQWASRLISEDTTYSGFSNKLGEFKIQNNFIAARTTRWKFAWQVYIKEYNWRQKIFGGGFNFLNWFGFVFLGDKTVSDYPHNPFLSILLYSGIIGLILYLFLLYNVFNYYLKYLKENYLFFIFFLITLFFSFFSAGSPFDPPIMGFFILLPFLINSIYKKDNA